MRNQVSGERGRPSIFKRIRDVLPWLIVVVGSLLLGAWVVLGDAVALVHADTLIPALVSLQRWTLYYWGQDRWGMLLPALAMPIRHPLANLLTQLGVGTAAALLVIPMLHRYLLAPATDPGLNAADAADASGAGPGGGGGGGGRWSMVWSWLVGAIVLLAVASGGYQMDLFFTQPYAVGLVLGVGGLLVLDRLWRVRRHGWAPTSIGAALLTLSLWVNLAGVVILGPLLVWRIVSSVGWRGLFRSRGWVQLLPMGLAAYVGDRLRDVSGQRHDYGWLPVHEWPEEAWHLIEHAAAAASPATGDVLLLAAVLGLVSQVIRPDTPRARRVGRQAAGLLGIALFYLVVASANRHVANNGTAYRYALPAFVLILSAAAMVSGLMWVGRPRIGWPLATLAAVALLGLGLVLRHGTPSYDRARRVIDEKFGQHTRALLDTDADFVAGQYWDVWHAVFHANLTLYERGQARRLYGMTHRGDAARDRWPALNAATLIAVPRTPESLEQRDPTFVHFNIADLRQTRTAGPFELWSPRPGASDSAPADAPTAEPADD